MRLGMCASHWWVVSSTTNIWHSNNIRLKIKRNDTKLNVYEKLTCDFLFLLRIGSRTSHVQRCKYAFSVINSIVTKPKPWTFHSWMLKLWRNWTRTKNWWRNWPKNTTPSWHPNRWSSKFHVCWVQVWTKPASSLVCCNTTNRWPPKLMKSKPPSNSKWRR